MSNTSSRHDITVTDNGTIKKLTKEAEGLNSTLDKSANTAKKLSPAVPRAAAAAAGQASKDSGTARGVGGLTGAEGRDFAKQSQGLGGIVRLYATFAANLFAATAAFGALSRAADTTNMVKGLDQLGAASGRNLGSLAKRVVQATDNAISLRDAMESVSKASSAGLDTKQILALSESAKKASQALGVDMADAMSRLTRGISKLEPELLDELGLFTKVDKSTQDYARSVGKATASLTDFERRQAFANAVLAEAKQKFSVIDIPANPYNKLLASFQNVAQSGLELVNKVLGPLVGLLAQSPTALAAVMAGIAAMLLKTAVPALGHWREGLKSSAEQAAKTAQTFRDSFDDEFNERLNASFRIPDLERQFEQATKSAEKAQNKIKNLKLGSDLSDSKRTQFQGYIDDPDSKARVQRAIKDRQDLLAADSAGVKTLSAERKLAAEAELRDLKRIKAAREEATLAGTRAAALKGSLTSAQEGAQGTADKKIGYFDTQSVAARNAEKLQNTATKSRLVSLAAENAAILGVGGAMRQLNADIAKEGLGVWNRYSTVARGALAAVSTRVFGLISSLGNIGLAIGIAVGAFQLLDAIFSKNTKQMEAFDTAIQSANSSAELMGKTLANNAKQADYGISIRGIMAISSAFKEVTNSVEDLNDKFSSAKEAQGRFDSITNGIKSIFGKSLQQTYAKNLTTTIIAGLDGINSPTAKAKAEANIKRLLGGIGSLSKEVLQASLASSSDILGIGKAIQEELVAAGKGMDEASKAALNYNEVISRASKTYDEFTVGIANTSPLFKMGSAFAEVGTAILGASKDLRSGIAALIDVAEDSSKLRFLSPESQTQLLGFLPGLKQAQLEIGATQSKIDELKQDIEELESRNTPEVQARVRAAGVGNNGGTAEQLTAAKQTLSALETFNTTSRNTAKNIIEAMTMGAKEVAAKGEALIGASLAAAKQMAAISITRATVAGMSGVGTAAIQASLQREEISVQERSIIAMEELTLATLTAATRQTEAALTRDLGKGTPEEQAYTRAQLDTVKQVLINVTNKTADQIDESYNTATEAVKQGMLAFRKVTVSLAEKRVESNAKRRVNQLEEERGTRGELSAQSTKSISARLELFNIESDIAKLYTQQYSILDESNMLIQQGAEVAKKEKEDLLKRKVLNEQIVEAVFRYSQLRRDSLSDPKNKELEGRKNAAGRNLELARAELDVLNEQLAATDRLLRVQQEQAIIRAKFARDRQTIEFLQQQEDYAVKLRDVKEEGQQSELDYLAKVGAVTGANLVLERQKLDNKKIERDLEAELLSIERDKNSKLNTVRENTALELRDKPGISQLDKQALLDQEAQAVARINAGSNSAVTIANTKFEQAKKYNNLLAEEEVRQQRINDLVGNLSAVFGELGNTMGSIAKIFSDMVTQQELIAKNTEDRANAEVRLADAIRSGSAGKEMEAQEELNKLNKTGAKLETDRAKNDIANSAKLAGAAKNLFKEKTAAYRGFAAVEKALQVQKLLLDAKEIAMDVFKTGQAITNAIVRATASKAEAVADGGAAIVNQGKGDPYTAFARMAAMATFVASILGSSSSAKTPPAGFSGEEQQAVQGTGQSYQDGKIVNRGGGALGDPTAKANSLNNSIDLIEQHTFDTLEYSNKMLESLRGIKSNTDNLSAILLQSGINVKGNEELGLGKQEASGVRQTLGTAVLFGLAGLAITSILGDSKIGKTLNSIVGSVLGGKRSSELADTGIQLSGAIETLASGGKDIGSIYQNIKQTKSGGWFSSDKTWYEVVTKPLEKRAAEAIGNVFAGIIGTVKSAADVLGKDESSVNAIVKSFNVAFKASFKDLKPEELTAALNAEFSVAFNQLAEKVLPEFQKFRKAGEEYGDTVVRLARDIQVVELSFTSIGKTLTLIPDKVASSSKGLLGLFSSIFSSITSSIPVNKVEVVERLVEMAGGIDAFMERTEFFKDNFLTVAEKLAPVQDALTTRMTELGISSIDSREKFSLLVKAINVSTEGGAKLYTELMGIAEAFAEVYPETRKVLSAEEKKVALLSQQIDIYKAEGKSILALYASRKDELEQMDDSLKLGQLYLYALEDEAGIKAKLTTAYQKEKSAIEGTIKSLSSSIKTLDTYKQSLLIAAQSNLTPLEKYAETKSEAERVAALAAGVLAADASAEAIQAKNDAINQLPQVSSAFLDASRIVFASSEAYNRDFSYIQDLIDSTSSALDLQMSDAEMQLERLDASVSALNLIEENTATTASLILELAEATRNSQQLAGPAAARSGYTINAIDMASITDAFTTLFAPYAALIPSIATIMPITDAASSLGTTPVNAASIQQLATTLTAINNNVISLRNENQAQAEAVVTATVETTDDLNDSITGFVKGKFFGGYRGWDDRAAPQLDGGG